MTDELWAALALLPGDAYALFNFHVALLRHGQRICTWRSPRCGRCPLRDMCNWYQEHRARTGGGERLRHV